MIRKSFENHLGVDLVSTDQTRPANFSKDMLNMVRKILVNYKGIEKRQGAKYVGDVDFGGVYGLIPYTYTVVDRDASESQVSELLVISDTLYRMVLRRLVVNCSSPPTGKRARLVLDEDIEEYKFQLIEGSTIVLNTSLGTGYVESSPVSVADLITAITGVSGYTTSLDSGADSSVPAARIFLLDNQWDKLSNKLEVEFTATSSGGSIAMYYYELEEIPSSSPRLMYHNATEIAKGYRQNKTIGGQSVPEWDSNPTWAILNDCVYIANGHGYICKYDGRAFYNAGFSIPKKFALAESGTGSGPDEGWYRTGYYLEFVDNKKNVIQSDYAVTSDTLIPPGGRPIIITAGAMEKAEVSTTLTADTTLGTVLTVVSTTGMSSIDYLYFFDRNTKTYRSEEILSITSTTITLDTSLNATLLSGDKVYTVPNIKTSSHAHRPYLKGAKLNGSVSVLTSVITVYAGHNLSAGDVVYYFKTSEGTVLSNTVESVTSTTVTLSSDVIDIDDGSYLSTLVTAFFRTVSAATQAGLEGLPYYFLGKRPTPYDGTTHTYEDTSEGGSTPPGALLADAPRGSREAPPPGKIITTLYNRLCVAGFRNSSATRAFVVRGTRIEDQVVLPSGSILLVPTEAASLVFEFDPNSVYYSSAIHPEQFPEDNNWQVVTPNGEAITSIKQINDAFVVAERRALTLVTGDFGTLRLRFEVISTTVGISSHHSVQESDGFLIFLSGERGIWSVNSGGLFERSKLIAPKFIQDKETDYLARYEFAAAQSYFDASRRQYVLLLPTLSPTNFASTVTLANEQHFHTVNSNHLIVVEDINMGQPAYYFWRMNGIDFLGGAAFFNGELYFVERQKNATTGFMRCNIYRRKNSGRYTDYSDDTKVIEAFVETGFDSVGEPSIDSNFTRLNMFIDNVSSVTDTTLVIETKKNYVDSVAQTITKTLDGTGGVAGPGDVGTTGLSSAIRPDQSVKLNTKARSLSVKIKNTETNRNLEINGIELDVRDMFIREIRR